MDDNTRAKRQALSLQRQQADAAMGNPVARIGRIDPSGKTNLYEIITPTGDRVLVVKKYLIGRRSMAR